MRSEGLPERHSPDRSHTGTGTGSRTGMYPQPHLSPRQTQLSRLTSQPGELANKVLITRVIKLTRLTLVRS